MELREAKADCDQQSCSADDCGVFCDGSGNFPGGGGGGDGSVSCSGQVDASGDLFGDFQGLAHKSILGTDNGHGSCGSVGGGYGSSGCSWRMGDMDSNNLQVTWTPLHLHASSTDTSAQCPPFLSPESKSVTSFVGKFKSGDGEGFAPAEQVLVYDHNSRYWWLGDYSLSYLNAEPTWTKVSDTSPSSSYNFGDLVDSNHRMFKADFNHDHYDDILVYNGIDGKWWLGKGSSSGTLSWNLASNTFGGPPGGYNYNSWADSNHRFFVGDFNGDGFSDVMVGNIWGTWYLGIGTASNTIWFGTVTTDTAGFGDILESSHKIFVGDFNGDGRTDMLFYYNGDGNWWLGAAQPSGALNWSLVANSQWYAANLLDGTRRFFPGYWNFDFPADILFFDSNYNLWVALYGSASGNFTWSYLSQTGFGNLLDGQHALFSGDFAGTGFSQMMFLDHMAGDKNLWFGMPMSAGYMEWFLADGSGVMDWPFKL